MENEDILGTRAALLSIILSGPRPGTTVGQEPGSAGPHAHLCSHRPLVARASQSVASDLPITRFPNADLNFGGGSIREMELGSKDGGCAMMEAEPSH